MNGKWKLDRRQSELRTGNVERTALRDLAAHHHIAGEFQRRRYLECHRRHQRRIESGGICAVGAVFCYGHCKNLRQLCGDEETGTGVQVLHPLCAGAGGGDLGHGTDDRGLSGSPGHGDNDHRLGWPDGHVGNSAAGRDGEHHRGCWLFRFYPLMGGDAAGLPFYLGSVPRDDPDGV